MKKRKRHPVSEKLKISRARNWDKHSLMGAHALLTSIYARAKDAKESGYLYAACSVVQHAIDHWDNAGGK